MLTIEIFHKYIHFYIQRETQVNSKFSLDGSSIENSSYLSLISKNSSGKKKKYIKRLTSYTSYFRQLIIHRKGGARRYLKPTPLSVNNRNGSKPDYGRCGQIRKMRLRRNIKVNFNKFKTYTSGFELTGEFNILDARGFQIIIALFNK